MTDSHGSPTDLERLLGQLVCGGTITPRQAQKIRLSVHATSDELWAEPELRAVLDWSRAMIDAARGAF